MKPVLIAGTLVKGTVEVINEVDFYFGSLLLFALVSPPLVAAGRQAEWLDVDMVCINSQDRGMMLCTSFGDFGGCDIWSLCIKPTEALHMAERFNTFSQPRPPDEGEAELEGGED